MRSSHATVRSKMETKVFDFKVFLSNNRMIGTSCRQLVGEVANLNKEERMSYEASLKRKLDWESALSTARRDGKRETTKKIANFILLIH